MLARLRQQYEGFTLIEFIVLLIIIGILAAIAIPVFLSQRSKAERDTKRHVASVSESKKHPKLSIEVVSDWTTLPGETSQARTLRVNGICVLESGTSRTLTPIDHAC